MARAQDKTQYITADEFKAMKQRRSTTGAQGKSKVTETDIQGSIRDFLRLHGWYVVPHLQGLGSFRGIPDLSACSPSGEHWWIEVKKPTGALSKYQKEFRDNVLSRGGKWMMATSVEDVEPLVRGDSHG